MWDIIFRCSNLLYPSNRKVCRNIVSFSHSILSVILIKLDVQFRLIVLCSGSYFLWDILHMLEYKFEILYFYHHLATIYFLFSSYEQHVIKTLLFTAELSNFPTFQLLIVDSVEINRYINGSIFWHVLYQGKA